MSSLFLFLIVIVSLSFIAVLVLAKNYKISTNQYFFVFICFSVVWILINYLENIERFKNYSELFLKTDFSVAVLLSAFFYLFCLSFLEKRDIELKKKLPIYLIATLAASLSFSNLIIKNISFFEKTVQFQRSVFFYFYVLVIILFFAAGFWNLINKYKRATEKIEKLQISYVVTGLWVAIAIPVFLNLILPQLVFVPAEISRIGIYSIIVFCVLAGYSILKHRLFDVKVIATEISTFAIWALLLVRILMASNWQDRIIDGSLFVLVVFFGFLLIRSVLKEVRQREEIQKLSEFKTELLSIVAHQIKNPLVVIKGYASLVEDKTICDAEAVSDVFKKIKAAAGKLVMLLNNLLDLHHLEEGKMHYEFQKLELNRFLKDIIDGFQIFARQKNLDLIFESSPAEVYVDGDTYKLSQVFQNLIDNAIKYTDKGYVKVSVESKEKAIIAVSDSGQGMSRDTTQRLFQKFSRGAGEVIHGSGLGLYISKEIVDAHQGKIRAESDGEGKGSKLLVELPKAK